MPTAAVAAVAGGAAVVAAAAGAGGGRGGARPPWAERCSSAPAECFPCWGSRTLPCRTEKVQNNNQSINQKVCLFSNLIFENKTTINQ
jgi:hypothetical protein